MSDFELAQLNIAVIRAPLHSPPMADFVANLEQINSLAERSSGFVWRLQTPEGDATALRPLDESTIVNMSVWRDLKSLNAFVFRSDHVQFMRRRREWFVRMAQAYMVLWWIPRAHRPSLEEAFARLAGLRSVGATAAHFTFREPFTAPDAPPGERAPAGDECPA